MQSSEFVSGLMRPGEDDAAPPLQEDSSSFVWSPHSPSTLGTDLFEATYDTEDEIVPQPQNGPYNWDVDYSPPHRNRDRSMRYYLSPGNTRYPLSRSGPGHPMVDEQPLAAAAAARANRGLPPWTNTTPFSGFHESDETINELFEDAVRRPM